MLKIPEIKFNYSVNQSNVDPNAMGDWLEACTLFDGPDITKSDVVDMLLENQICTDENQDLAHLIADEGWEELIKRKYWEGVPEYVEITTTRIRSQIDWQDDPIRSFFVFLSALRIYPDWAKDYKDYSAQGELFERIVETICPYLLPEWTTYRVGWSPDNTNNITQIIKELSSRLFVPGAANMQQWLDGYEKDGGLDLVCYRSFPDEREAMPLFLLQCASGKNWRNKIETPNPNFWQKLLDSAVCPSTGIVAPFVIDTKELRVAALLGQIIVFDRIRLLSVVQQNKVQLDDNLKNEIINWLLPRIKNLPFA